MCSPVMMQDSSCTGLRATLRVLPALYLPLSPLLRSLLEVTNSALSKFVEDQTVHGFLPLPGRRHRRYYEPSSSSSFLVRIQSRSVCHAPPREDE